MVLVREGYHVNRKRAQRFGRLGGLRVAPPKILKSRVRRGTIVEHGQHPHHVLTIPSQFDETADGRPVKVLKVTDEFTQEALAISAARSITAAGTVAGFNHVRQN